MAESQAFELLHDGVRRQLWKMGWTSLRPLQADSIRHILTRPGHVVLSSGTASGKTEAAFLPILSSIADEPDGSIRVVYVGPLKALINDQFARVEELCSHIEVPVHRWHGDVGADAKTRLITAPGGVLLITPESLESLFVNRPSHLARIFLGLQFVVIDELHSFLDNERGLHLRSLLYRLIAITRSPPRLVGLSATIGDSRVAKAYLDRNDPENVCWILGESSEAELRMRLHAYVAGETDADSPGKETSNPPRHCRDMAANIVEHCHGYSNLIFANSRNDVEYYGDLCGRLAAADGLQDQFLVHHGSLSAGIRQEAEEVMKESSRGGQPATAFCTRTLEMGIDIGSVRTVGQIGAPSSVASLKQRVGRSGRRQGAPRILRMYLECPRIDDKSDLFDRLHLPLIQSIAVTQLLLEGWVEPAIPTSFDLSTLTQQIISLISETGARAAHELFRILCQSGAFHEIEQRMFTALLRQLGAQDVIEQTAQGDLILGLAGEDLRKDKGFYAAFPTPDTYTVLHDGQRIGSVDDVPAQNQHMILAGRRWRVVDVDTGQLVVWVVPAVGSRAAPFAGGGEVVHPRIVAEMRRVLSSRADYTYLNEAASQLLREARTTAIAARICSEHLIALDTNRTAIMVWAGGRVTDNVLAIFKSQDIECGGESIAVVIHRSLQQAREIIDRIDRIPLLIFRILMSLFILVR